MDRLPPGTSNEYIGYWRAGFIGSALIRYLINETAHRVINVDKLTYAGNVQLASVSDSERYEFSKTDICDRQAIDLVFADFEPDIIMHLAAESHVDRSIQGPADFVETNIVGTYQLLEATRNYWSQLVTSGRPHSAFTTYPPTRFTVIWRLQTICFPSTPYSPSSPYSASKASSDRLVRAWYRTFGLPVVLTNCSNNYGPYHFPEKLIPHMILNALAGKDLPVYGKVIKFVIGCL